MPNPRDPSRWWKVVLVTSAIALPSLAAMPEPGSALPSFTAEDLLGHEHASREYAGKATLLVAITHKNAGDGMRRWFEAADAHIPGGVQRESLISLHVPFFVGIGTVRHRVKQQVPQQFWDDTLLDRDGDMARVLGLGSSKEPYVFALDEHGRVLAAVHGPADSPDAARIWSSLSTPRVPAGTPPASGWDTSPPGGAHGPENK
ncbi:hypothetical protein JRI60_33350 [Archangium violaceum]|uniref:hypothetical protein n=1 Tax=Archangium violaceum TaxID=83451 RepID=UPI0019507A3C|nr:hypothetical protein [Archangium violaceum]QRN94018.1 hypothetical protein JRI60_33350 [Archangium violaceum]